MELPRLRQTPNHAGPPATLRRVVIWMTPPVAPSPYSTLLPPRTISMRSTVSIGIVDSTVFASSFSFRRTPSTMITMFCALLVPKPRRSSAKSGDESRLWRPNTPPILRIAALTSFTPALRMSSWVMTVAPIGCRVSTLGKREPVMTTVDGLPSSSAWAAKGMAQASESDGAGRRERLDGMHGCSVFELGRCASPHAGSYKRKRHDAGFPCPGRYPG
jgi:hypothetical protein